MTQSPKLLITGASGFTGQHACNHFLKAGFDVIGVTRKNNLSDNEIKIESCDLTNKDEVIKLVKKTKPQYLLHLAGQNHVGHSWVDPISSLEANSMSTANLLEAIRQEKLACKIIIVGSALQFDLADLSTLTHPYSISKTLQVVIAQSWAYLYDMHIVIAKPSNLIGPGFSNGVCSIFAKKIIDMEGNNAEKILEVNNLNAQRHFVDVRDVISAYEILLTKGKTGEIYDIASSHSYSLEEVIKRFRTLTPVNFEVKTSISDQVEGKIETPLNKVLELGWKQTIPIESSLKDILEFYRQILGQSKKNKY